MIDPFAFILSDSMLCLGTVANPILLKKVHVQDSVNLLLQFCEQLHN